MFGDYSQDLLRNGIIELKAGNRETARRYLDRAVYMSGDHEVMAEVWYWLSQVADSDREKRQALENCLANDLQHARARRALAVLDGKLKVEEIIDPNAVGPAVKTAALESQRFMCAKCGGRMSYSPDGKSLVCEYCRRRQSVKAVDGGVADNDFILTMATQRGHNRPLLEAVLHCQGCGAEFILPAGALSYTCAYCDSPHVVQVERSRDLVAPDGVIPHAFDEGHAEGYLRDWWKASKLEPRSRFTGLRGLYLPVWAFVLAGGVDYVGETTAEEGEAVRGRPAKPVQVRDRYPVLMKVTVAASRRPSAPLVRMISGFDLSAVRPYDPRYLASWPAELYDVSMADASLEARSQAYAGVQRDLPALVAPVRVISTSSANITIESFRLELLPVWMIEVSLDGRPSILLINGQTGAVRGDGLRPRSGKANLLDRLGELLAE